MCVWVCLWKVSTFWTSNVEQKKVSKTQNVTFEKSKIASLYSDDFFSSLLSFFVFFFFDILYSFGFDKIIIEFIHIKLNLYYIYNTFRSCHFQSEIVWLWHLRRTPYKYFQTFNTLYLCVVYVARDCCPIIYLMFAIWNSTNAKSSRNSSSIHNHRSYNIQNNTIFIRSNI